MCRLRISILNDKSFGPFEITEPVLSQHKVHSYVLTVKALIKLRRLSAYARRHIITWRGSYKSLIYTFQSGAELLINMCYPANTQRLQRRCNDVFATLCVCRVQCHKTSLANKSPKQTAVSVHVYVQAISLGEVYKRIYGIYTCVEK